MIGRITRFAVLATLVVLTGCAGLGKMKTVSFTEQAEADKALVNIVRRSVFMGDGANVEMWDGEKFIGTLAAGKLLQYQAEPGEHTFMAYIQGNWGTARGELEAGKTYYLKFNMSGFGPISLGVASAEDERIDEWKTMKTVVMDESSTKAVPEKYLAKARLTLEKVESGTVIPTAITAANAQ